MPLSFAQRFLILLFLSLACHVAVAEDKPITLQVDARHPSEQKFPVQEEIPIRSGKVDLDFPHWVPGTHGMSGLLQNVANLKIRAGDRLLDWQRDLEDPYTVHCQVPEHTDHLTVTFDYLPQRGGYSEVAYGVAASENIAVINGASLFFIPHGQSMRKVMVRSHFLLPEGWQFASALPVDQAVTQAGDIAFAPVSLEMFVDSPMMAGKFLQKIRLDNGEGKEVPHYLCLFTDDAALKDKVLTPVFQQSMKQLVLETGALFGARHYPQFHFLLAVGNKIPVYGLEHHACSVNSLRPDAFSQKGMLDNKSWWNPNLIPHEYSHSWDGKYRRPRGLFQETYNTPQRTDLLWVYEGLAEYLGEILMVRSGFRDVEKWKIDLMETAVQQGNDPRREWQSLSDAAAVYPFMSQAGNGEALRDGNAIYFEGLLLWLEADTLIRRESKGQKSLDDFCRIFFGGTNNGVEVRPYDRRDVAEALQQVLPYDWNGFLEAHLNARGNAILSAGIENAGWKVSLLDTVPPDLIPNAESDYRFGLGIRITGSGSIWYVKPDSVAAKAKLTRDMRIAGVNGKQFTPAVFREAVRATKGDKPTPLQLLIFQDDTYRLVSLDYTGGEKFPILERQTGSADLLASIITPRLPPPPTKN